MRKYLSRALRIQRNPRARGETTFDIALCYAHQGEFNRADAKIEEARQLNYDVTVNDLLSVRARTLADHEDETVRNYYAGLLRRFEKPAKQ